MLDRLAPLVDQDGAHPFIQGAQRTVKVKAEWSLAEVLMEPIFYNPCLGGRWGERPSDPQHYRREEREKPNAKATLIRVSDERRDFANVYYMKSKDMAAAGFTHMAHLVTTDRPGVALAIINWPEFTALTKERLGRHASTPLDRESFDRLVRAIPDHWKRAVNQTSDRLVGRHRPTGVASLLREEAPRPGEWLQMADGTVSQVQFGGTQLGTFYETRLSGRLAIVQAPGDLTLASVGLTTRIVVWEASRIAKCQLEQEAWDRARARGDDHLQPGAPKPPELLFGGPLVDEALLESGRTSISTAGTDPSQFGRGFAVTDRKRDAITCANVDTHTLYFMLISDEFRPIRTFDPSHQASTTWSTSWVGLLQHDDITPSKMRHTIFGSLASGALNAKARDLLYRVLADSLPLGPVRCPRKDETKGICSLCLLLRGQRCTESTRHLFLECPYTQHVLGAVYKAFTSRAGTPAQRARARDMTCGEVCSYQPRPLARDGPRLD